jgi:hypothetical protein
MPKQSKTFTSARRGGFFLTVPCKYLSRQREIEAIDLEKSNHERRNSES